MYLHTYRYAHNMYLITASLESKRKSARALHRWVLPTPVGPTSRNVPNGRSGD